ncbi:DUF5723 family protein [Flavitalea flava]
MHENNFTTNFDLKNPNKLYQLTLSAEALGPSFHLEIAPKQVIGFTLVSRSYANIKDIPGHVGQNAYAYLLANDLWNTPYSDHTTKLNGMDWLEYGLNYATVLYKNGRTEWKAGISLKYLQGIGAAYVKNTNLNYMISDTTHILFTHSVVDYGRTDYDSYRKINNYNDLNHGNGFGANIGFTCWFIRIKQIPSDGFLCRYTLFCSKKDQNTKHFTNTFKCTFMKTKSIILMSTILAGLTFAGNWSADTSKAKIMFSVKGPFGTVHGSFSGLKTTIQFNEKDLTGSSISASIEATTVSTGIGLRNSDLRKKEEWLNAEKFPQISFHSKKIEKKATGYSALGDLTLKGITKPIEIPFSFSADGASGLFKGQFTINRHDYNLGKSGGSVGEIITINLQVPVTKKG